MAFYRCCNNHSLKTQTTNHRGYTMKNLYEVINTESKNLQFARDNCLEAMQIAKELSKLDIIEFDVLKNGLRFATAYNGKIDIILPKKTFLEG